MEKAHSIVDERGGPASRGIVQHLRNSCYANSIGQLLVRVVDLGELVASKDEEGGASHQFGREPSELSFVFFQPGVVRVSDNGKMVAMSARHHEHSLSKSRIRFSESIKSLGLSVEILEFGSLYWFEHFI